MNRGRARPATALIVAVVLGVSVGCGRDQAPGLGDLFPSPETVDGAEGVGPVEEYREEALYDFLDGGAELYFDYGIEAVAAAEYRMAGDAIIEVAVYDMGGSPGAFGIYSSIRYAGGTFVDVGNEGMLTTGSLDFWKGGYYCRLLSFGARGSAEDNMVKLGRSVASRIGEAGTVPDIVGLLPALHRVPRSEKYFTGEISLNNVRYVGAGNPLKLGEETRGAAALYGPEGEVFTAFMIEYASDSAASRALEAYSSGPDDGGTVIQGHGRFVIGTWDGASPEAQAVLEEMLTALDEM
jgi:hypothetical protein